MSLLIRPCAPPILPLIWQPLCPCIYQDESAGERGCCWCFPAAAKSSGMNTQLRNKPVLFVDFYTNIVFLWGSLLCLLIGKNNNKTTKMSTNMTKWMTLMFLFNCWFKSQGENYLSNECGCTDVCNVGFTRTLFTFFIHQETGDWKDGKAKRLQIMHFNASDIFIKWNWYFSFILFFR